MEIWFSSVRGRLSTVAEALASTEPSWMLIKSRMRRSLPLASAWPLAPDVLACATSGVTFNRVSAVTLVSEAS